MGETHSPPPLDPREGSGYRVSYRSGRVKKYTFWDVRKYQEVLKLRKQGFTLTKISSVTGVPVSTVSRWCRGDKPWDARFRLYFKPKPVEYKAVAYLLGVLDSDGYLTYDRANREYYIGLDTGCDEVIFVDRVRKIIKYLIGRETREYQVKACGRMIRYRIGSRGLYEYFSKLKGSMRARREVIERNQYTMRMYVLGFVDGDGSLQKRKIRIQSTDKRLIRYLLRLLNSLGFNIEKRSIKRQAQKGGVKVIRGKEFRCRRDVYYVDVSEHRFRELVGLTIKVVKRWRVPRSSPNFFLFFIIKIGRLAGFW